LLQLTNTKGAIQVKTMRKPTRKIVVTTAVSLLVVASLSVSAYAASNVDKIKKNQLMTETSSAVSTTAGNFTADESVQQDTKTVKVDGPVTEAQAIEIGKQALTSMFGVDVSKNNLTQDALYLGNEQIKGSTYASPVWSLNWMSPNLMNSDAVGDDIETHTVTLDAETGKIVNINSNRAGWVSQSSAQNITEESAKSIVRDFIEKNGLANGTSIEEINVYTIPQKAYLAKLKLANGQTATVVVSLTGNVFAYESDVEDTAFPVPTYKEMLNKDKVK
jgi:hypothetical protein